MPLDAPVTMARFTTVFVIHVPPLFQVSPSDGLAQNAKQKVDIVWIRFVGGCRAMHLRLE
jgi:hypothetical protein